jgi:hypothetical protein
VGRWRIEHGLLLTDVVLTASMQDRDGAKPALLSAVSGNSCSPP